MGADAVARRTDSENGRFARAPVRRYGHASFRNEPCGGCTDRDDKKGPGAVSPHAAGRGSLIHFLTEDVLVEIVEDRTNVSRKVLKKHYDQRTKVVKLEQRRGYFENI